MGHGLLLCLTQICRHGLILPLHVSFMYLRVRTDDVFMCANV